MHDQNIQMVDLTSQYLRLKAPLDKAIENVLSTGQYINGQEVKAFARSLEAYLNVSHVVPCGNGTDALQAALMALDLEPGDEIIVPTFSFIATVEVVSLLGLKPVLVDVDPDTYNIDPAGVQKAINARTRAIIPVHLYGQTAAMDEIMQLAQKHNLYVIEDAAQSLGANCDFEGKHPMLGTIGHIGCTSFFPSKNLGCFGDGGACFTNDEVLAEKMLMIVNHGARKKYYNERVGMNSRLDTIHAAVLNEKIKHLDDFIAYRRKVADAYYEQLDGVPFLQLPVIDQRGQHTFNQFTIRVLDGKRDAFKQFLSHHGIPSMIYYPSPLHRQPVFQRFCRSGFSLPVGDMLCQQVLSLPMHTELTKNDQMYITHTIRQFK